MKSNTKSKILILITLGILFTFIPIMTTNFGFITVNTNKTSEYKDDSNLEKESLKLSAVSGPIHIINNSGWVDFRNDGNCTGSGTYSDPYVIENLVIDGGGSGSCIWIENSDVYFRIENCTLYNSIGSRDAGILLSKVNKAQLINNTCSSNYNGIYLENCDNNSISKNIVQFNSHDGIILEYCNFNIVSYNIVRNNTLHGIIIKGDINTLLENNVYNNDQYGFFLQYCNNSTISGNIAHNNQFYGIELAESANTTISGNIVNFNRQGIGLDWAYYNVISGNIVDNNIYYGIYLSDHSDKNTVSKNNISYNEQSGIFLSHSDDNAISGNILMYNGNGIWLHTGSDYNKISGNRVYNSRIGIGLYQSNYNIVSGNILIGNDECIIEINCQGNVLGINVCGVPLVLIITISCISGGAVIVSTTFLLIRRKRKRIE